MPRWLGSYEDAEAQGLLWEPSDSRAYGAVWVIEPGSVRTAAGKITDVRDRSGWGRDLIQTNASYRPDFISSSPYFPGASAKFTENQGHYLRTPATFPVGHIFVVAEYNGGADTTFNEYTYILASYNTSNGIPRCVGDLGSNLLRNTTSEAFFPSYANGSDSALAAFLPCPPRLTRIDDKDSVDSSNANGWTIMATTAWPGIRAWQGEMKAYALAPSTISEHERQLLEGYLAWTSFRQPGKLVGTHPFAFRPPLKGD